jgi:hypothetical protein
MLIQNDPRIEQWHESVCQKIIDLDHGPYNAFETAMLHSLRKANAKYLQKPANFIG